MKVYHGVGKVYYGVGKVNHGASPVQSSPVESSKLQKQSVPTDGLTDSLSIFQGQSNIRTVATVTDNQPNNQPREYRAFQIVQSIPGLGRIANLEYGN